MKKYHSTKNSVFNSGGMSESVIMALEMKEPKETKITFEAAAEDYLFLEKLYNSAAGGSPVSAD